MIVILVFPAIGILVFIIFGVYPLRKKQRQAYLVQQKNIIKHEDWVFSDQVRKNDDLLPLFVYGLENQIKPVSKDNKIEIIDDNTQLFEKSVELVRSAKEYINVQSYIFSYSGF
ncbi:MAG: hypothetical protein MJ223_04090 [Mycoplasmoidaceae bacterium]|nr:hypothetical protein [Mycoplasmoidaceae bacterium]